MSGVQFCLPCKQSNDVWNHVQLALKVVQSESDVEDTDSIDYSENVIVGMLGAEEPIHEDGGNVQEGEDIGNDGGSNQAADYRDEGSDDTSASSDWEYNNWEDKAR